MPRQRKDLKPIVPVTQVAPVAQISQRPALLQIMKEGFGFGIGNALAHRVVASAFSSDSANTVKYEKCVEKYDTEICKELYK